MLSMIQVGRSAGLQRKILFIFIFLYPIFSLCESRWDSQGAANAFQEARKKRSDIDQSKNAGIDQYIDCAKTYRKVYSKDPHFGRSGDALYEEGLVYQEIGDKFGGDQYYKTAAKRFSTLVSGYGGNQHCRDALLRLISLSLTKLGDEASGQEAANKLKTRYHYSAAAIKKLFDENVIKPKTEEHSEPVPLVKSEAIIAPAAAPAATTNEDVSKIALVKSIHVWSLPDHTRVMIEMESEAKYEKATLANPSRIYFDILNAKAARDLLNRVYAVNDQYLSKIRIGQHKSDIVRIVLDIEESGDCQVTELHDPFSIVIDLKKSGATVQSPEKKIPPIAIAPEQKAEETPEKKPIPPAPAAAAKEEPIKSGDHSKKKEETKKAEETPRPKEKAINKEPVKQADESKAAIPNKKEPATKAVKNEAAKLPDVAQPTSRGDRTLTRTLGLKIGKIVLDPGHGGHDLGTPGPGGLLEKDLVLSIAKKLQKIIQDNLGAEVVLTRDEDVFKTLEERTEFANQQKADLFVSIHANSSRIRTISGVETYYLDFAKTDEDREIAARENATTTSNISDLEDLIKKIARADKSAESREFASIMQKRLFSGERQLFSNARNRGVKSAPFIVLIGANMPSILAEVAFISNPSDERLLKRDAQQDVLAKALYSGIESYMTTLGENVNKIQTTNRAK